MSVVIGLVGESLKRLLEAEMVLPTKVTLLSPTAESSLLSRVNLFAYRLTPNAFLANRDFLPIPGRPGELQAPPLGLSVFYLMTAHAHADPETGDADAHTLLGEAMRVLYENAIIPTEYLDEDLAPGTLRATLQLVDPDEVSRVWTALNEPFQLCAIYEVATANLAALATRPQAPQVTSTDVRVRTS